MSLFLNCLAKARDQGRLTKKAHDEAAAFFQATVAGLRPSLGGPSAEAVAAMRLAEKMSEAAKRKKHHIASQALAGNAARNAIAAHSKGKAAGLMGLMSRDAWEDAAFAAARPQGSEHVEGLSDVILADFFRLFGAGLEAMKSRFAGALPGTGDATKFIRESFGEDTGDPVAKAAWKGFNDAKERGVARALAGGKLFTPLEDWGRPQFWTTERVAKVGEAEWTRRMLDEVRGGNIDVMDAATGEVATPLAVEGIVRQAWDSIVTGGSRSGDAGARGQGVFNASMRVFRFKNADSYLRMMEEFGPGRGGLWEMARTHLDGMAREIALTETFGPNYRAQFAELLGEARREDMLRQAAGTKVENSWGSWAMRATGQQSWQAAERMFSVVTGDVNVPKNERAANWFGAIRSLNVAAKLGSAVISAVPGDTATMFLTARVNGIEPAKILSRYGDILFRDSATKREDAARLGLAAHAMLDSALVSRRFQDDIAGFDWAQRAANFVVRASGLQAHTEALKRAFSMEFDGMVAAQRERAFADLEEPFRNFLRRYGFDAGNWDTIRSGGTATIEGATYLDPELSPDRRLYERFLVAANDERRFAVIEPDARVRQLTTFGYQSGSLPGELWKSSFMFKSFPLTMMTTHLLRGAMGGAGVHRGAYLANLFLLTTTAGAAAIYAKDIINGKDPRGRISDPKFWAEAAFQGGGAGIFGDFVRSATSRFGSDFVGTVGGLPVQAAADVWNFANGIGTEALGGKDSNQGRELARLIRNYTPGSSLWYSRLLFDRFVIDSIQEGLDPNYRQSFARMEKRAREDYDQGYWWGPGKNAPTRAPDLTNPFR